MNGAWVLKLASYLSHILNRFRGLATLAYSVLSRYHRFASYPPGRLSHGAQTLFRCWLEALRGSVLLVSWQFRLLAWPRRRSSASRLPRWGVPLCSCAERSVITSFTLALSLRSQVLCSRKFTKTSHRAVLAQVGWQPRLSC